MKQFNIAQCIVDTMPPVDNQFQDQMKDFIQSNTDFVNAWIYSNSHLKNEADAISTLITQLRVDVCYQIFIEKLCEGDF